MREHWQSESTVDRESLVFPLFVTDNDDAMDAIPSLPGRFQIGVNRLSNYLRPLVQKGLRSVLIFGVPTAKNKVCRPSA